MSSVSPHTSSQQHCTRATFVHRHATLQRQRRRHRQQDVGQALIAGSRAGVQYIRSRLRAAAVDDVETSTSSSAIKFGMACSMGTRDEMEDTCNVVPEFDGEQSDAVYAAVFDGHGGAEVAHWLNDNLQDFVGPALAQSGNYEAALQAAFQTADNEILATFHSEPHPDDAITGAGATASVVVTRPNEVITANIGDSAAVLQRGTRQVMLTREHRVYGKSAAALAEIRRVRSTGGWVSRDGRVCDVLAVSRAFGDVQFKGDGLQDLLREGVEAEFWTQQFADKVEFVSDPVIATPSVTYSEVSEAAGDEFIVLASDGLWDFWSIPGVMKCARDSLILGATEQEVADILVDKALKRYSSDNVAVIVVTFPWTRSLYQAATTKRQQKKKGGMFGF